MTEFPAAFGLYTKKQKKTIKSKLEEFDDIRKGIKEQRKIRLSSD